MVIVRLVGGLGNQMFQYAFARSLALKHNSVLKVDISSFQSEHSLRKYSLDCFTLRVEKASEHEIEEAKKQNLSILQRFSSAFFNIKPSIKGKERSTQFDKRLQHVSLPVYLDGYFQSEKYFIDSAEQIRSDLVFKNSTSISSNQLYKQIKELNSVSIHIRRTDYVQNADINKVHGSCSIEYYQNAFDYFENRFQNIHFFIFSDDIAWAKDNLRSRSPMSFVSNVESSQDWEDLQLMSNCKHNVIANSSFSWWGAWLNQNPSKTVIAPQIWFADTTMNSDDIVPSSWIKL